MGRELLLWLTLHTSHRKSLIWEARSLMWEARSLMWEAGGRGGAQSSGTTIQSTT